MDEKPGARPPLAVLVADDLEVNRRLALLLLRHLGCEADAAKGGREACEMAMRRAYDLILMDVQMPGVDRVGIGVHLMYYTLVLGVYSDNYL